MRRYIIRRVLASVPMLVGVTFLAFVLISIIPADPAEVALRVNEIIPTPELIEVQRKALGLDRPFLERYAVWLYKAVQLDLGFSYTNHHRAVAEEIARCLPATLTLAAASLLFTLIISLPLAVLSAVWRGSIFDTVVRAVVFFGTAMPNYWAAFILIWVFGIHFDLLPTGGKAGWQSYLLPAFTLSLTYISTYVRLVRSTMLQTMQEAFVLYARARGLSRRRIILRHVFKNSLQSSITALGMSIPQLIAGTVVVESIFAWPGIGRLCISAIFNRDYPIIQAYVLMMGVLFIMFNLIVDIINAWIDPRQRAEG
ncbi:nickel/cobalt ABC transporter permease [Desulfovibrio psychrotolerans]|nr:nickel/cobalt ABC transporter permease [Desulfovibrio psychrotolerans]